MALSVVALVLIISQRFTQGTQRRHDICTEINGLKKILHDEHVPKLATANKNVAKYPSGVTIQTDQGPVHVSHEELVATQKQEQKIVDDTVPEPCPK